MTSFIDLFFPKRSNPAMAQAAHEWTRTPQPALPSNLAVLPGYTPGQYTRSYNHMLNKAIQAATSPDISLMSTLIKPQKQPTNPLPARDITYQNTSYNPATPTPETREKLFADIPNVTESLILFPKEDEDATERRKIVRRHDGPRKDTVNIPAMNAEMLLLEAMRRAPEHERSTGENERLPVQENFLL